MVANGGASLKRTLVFAHRIGTVTFQVAPGQTVDIPLFPGVFKHAAADELAELLRGEVAVRKYTCEALRTAAWPILREFPREWLKACIPLARLRPGRHRALDFLLG